MKTKILAFALLACVAGFSAARVYAGEKNGGAGAVSFSVHQRGGWLGVSIQDITPKLAKKKNLKNDEGAYVNDVINDSPADSAGVKEGDVIIEFNGKTTDDADDLLRAVQKAKPGTKTSITVLRNNEKKSLAISVGKLHRNNRSEGFAFAPPMPGPHALLVRASGTWGLQLTELNEQLGEYFGAPNGKGLLVEKVEKKGAGAKAGFKAGDVITKVGKNSIEELRDLTDAIEDVEEGSKVEVEVLRKGASKTLTVEIESDDDPSSFNFHFENMPDREMMREFRFNGLPSDEMENLRIQLPKSLPDMRDLKIQIERLKEKMTQVTV